MRARGIVSLCASGLTDLQQDTSVDPCEDFYTYSCGKWDASASIPDDKTSWLRSWDIPSERIENEMKAAMEEDKGIVGTFYKSCMDEEAISKLGTHATCTCVAHAPCSCIVVYIHVDITPRVYSLVCRSSIDECGVLRPGNKPLQPMLQKVEEVKDMKSLTEMLVWMGNRDNGALFGWGVSPDSEHPETRAFYMSPGGMTLPDQVI
jgi:putative endopeptidase